MGKTSKKVGRPTKAPQEGMRVPLGLRVTAEIKEKIDAAAAASGRSQSQEAEFRLEHSFFPGGFEDMWIRDAFGSREIFGFVRIIAEVINETAQNTAFFAATKADHAQFWLDSPYAYEQIRKGIEAVLTAFTPAGDAIKEAKQIAAEIQKPGEPDVLKTLETTGGGLASVILGEVARGKPHNIGNARAIARIKSIHDDLGPATKRLPRNFVGDDFRKL